MIDSIRLQNFRSFRDATFELTHGVNIVVGPNASGKTNLLEAIYIACSLRSYKSKDEEVVQFNRPWARLDAITQTGSRTIKFQPQKTILLNDKTIKRPKLNDQIPVVLFEPEHLRLINGPPELRRTYIDDLLEQTSISYKKLRRSYIRCLAQRNRLLKQDIRRAKSEHFAWNISLSNLGGQIAEARLSLLVDINKIIQKVYVSIAGPDNKVEVDYWSRLGTQNYGTTMLRRLQSDLDEDVLRGFTGVGPHRDDITIKLNNQPADKSASRGEVRSLVLALKIIELKLIQKTREQMPTLLLDDVFSELDGKRRQMLTDSVKGSQTVITTTDADIILKHFIDSAHIIPMS